MSHEDDYLPLFVYGSLKMGQSGAALVEDNVLSREVARARGRRVETGAAYPGIVFDSEGAEVSGELLWLDRTTYAETIERVDAYERVPSLFRRVRVSAVRGEAEAVDAYAYEWAAAAQE